ncbi:MAG: nucleotidyltransferase family protein [Candidatus Atribacteria bacterium]|nr:nucleotidyltransferase family protein [Candidatus Atribacteria bacterium]
MVSSKLPIPEKKIRAFCRRWKVTEFALFGSILREDFRPESDVDVLVSFVADARWSLWDLTEMQQELEGIFGRSVDLVENGTLRNPFRRQAILSTKEVLYAAG